MELADDIMVIAGGKVSRFGPREEVLPKLQISDAASGVCPVPGGWRDVNVQMA